MIKKADISNFITKCRNFKYSNVLLFAIFATTVHWQNCLFFTLLNPELLNNPFFHTIKIAIAIFVASFIFIFKSKSWIMVMSLLINLWGMSNLIYSRANGILIDAHSIFMINNMNGFWKSVPFYIEWSDFVCFIATFVVGISCFVFSNARKSYMFGVLAFGVSIVFHVYSAEKRLKRNNPDHKLLSDIEYYNPFSLKKNMWIVNWDRASYSVELSILHHFVYQLNRCLSNVFTLDNINFSNKENSDIQEFMICREGGVK